MTAPVLATRARVLDDPENRKVVVDALRRGLSCASSSALLGLSREALRLYRKTDAEFHAACIRAVSEFEDEQLAIVRTASFDDAKHAQWILERRYPSKWSQRSEMRTVEPDDVDDRDDAHEMSDEELEREATK